MSLFQGSRYRFSDKIQITDAANRVNSVYVLRRTTVPVPEGSVPYTVKGKDTLESLAFDHYQDANKWYAIADVNPHVFWPLDLIPGTVVYLPPKPHVASV